LETHHDFLRLAQIELALDGLFNEAWKALGELGDELDGQPLFLVRTLDGVQDGQVLGLVLKNQSNPSV